MFYKLRIMELGNLQKQSDMVDRQEVRHTFLNRVTSIALRLAVSIALLLWIIKSIDLGMLEKVIISPRVSALVIMVILSIFVVFLGGVKLWVLFRGFSSINLWLFTGYFFFAGSIGSLIPAIFGDFTLVALVRRDKVHYHQSVSALLVDRFVTLLMAGFLFTPFTLAFVLPINPLTVFITTIGALAGFCILVIITARYAAVIFSRTPAAQRFWESLLLFFSNYRGNLLANVVIGLGRSVISGFALAFAFMAADLNPPIFPTICITSSLSVITHIPISLGGLGVYEGSGLILFEAIGMVREQILAGLLYQRLYIFIWAAASIVIMGFIILFHRSRRMINLPDGSVPLNNEGSSHDPL